MSEISVPITVRKAKIMTMEPAKYMSWFSKARNSKGPVVGKPKTTAVITEPEIIPGRTQPIVLISGLRAIRTGYLSRLVQGATPLARAVKTYCLGNSSSRLPRIIRIRPAVPPVPITITGIHIWASKSANLAADQGAF